MTKSKPEARKIVFKSIPLPKQKSVNTRHIPYPFDELRIGGDAMLVSHVTYGAVVLATRTYMRNNPNTAFYLSKMEEGTAVWRVIFGTSWGLSVEPFRRVAKERQNVVAQQIEDAVLVPVQVAVVQGPSEKRKQKKSEHVAVVVDEVYSDKKTVSEIDPALFKSVKLYDLRCEAVLRVFEKKNNLVTVGKHFGLKWNSVQVMCTRAKKMRLISNDTFKTINLVQTYESIAKSLGHANQYSFPSIFGNQ